MAQETRADQTKYTIRFPTKLNRKLRALAARNRRSIQTEVEIAVEKHVKTKPR